MRVEREAREREEEAQKQREGAITEETIYSAEEGFSEKHTKMDTEAGREAGTSQLHSRHKKGYMTRSTLQTQMKRQLWTL